MTIYQACKAIGLATDHHESDLYVEHATIAPGLDTRKLLAAFGKTMARPFVSQLDGRIWWDVPFAFDPFWERVQRRTAEEQAKEQR